MTTREKVRKAFRKLRKEGFFARMSYLCCSSCATAEMGIFHGLTPESNFAYFHKQDAEAFNKDGMLESNLMVRHGGSRSNEIVEILKECCLEVSWNNDMGYCIEIKHDQQDLANCY